MWRYGLALLRANSRGLVLDWRRTLLMSAMMFLQNGAFFLLWVVFFTQVSHIRGWQLPDVVLLFGLTAFAVGLLTMLGDGVRAIAEKIQNGELDRFLALPRHPLLPLICARANPAGLGDVLFGLAFLGLFAGLHGGALFLALLTGLVMAALCAGVIIMFHTLAFFVRVGRMPEQLFDVLICLITIPQHAHGLVMKLVLFTVLPAGFMTTVPVTALRQDQPALLLLLLAATCVYLLLARWLFDYGLRQYRQQG